MNITEKIKRIDWGFVGAVIVAWTLLLISIPKNIGENNLIYAIGELQAYDNNLFQGNIYSGSEGISPRYIIDALFGLIMHLNGGNWAGTDLLWIYFGVLVQAVAIANIAYRLQKKYSMIIAAVFSCLILYCGNYLAGFYLNELITTSIGTGIAFAVLGISFLVGDKRNYDLAWIFAGCSALCHIHEGIFCCCVIFIFAFADSLIQRKPLIKENRMMLVAVLALAAVCLPGLITDQADISDGKFVHIYSLLRHPHHLVPSTWGLYSISKTIMIDAGIFIICLTERKLAGSDKLKQKLYEAIALVGAWISTVVIMYLFTEIKPIAFVSTLFLSKLFKYVLLVALIWLMYSVIELRAKGHYISGYLFLYYGFEASSYGLDIILILTIIVCAVMYTEQAYESQEKEFISGKKLVIADVIFLLLMVYLQRKSLGMDNYFASNHIFSIESIRDFVLNFGMPHGFTVIAVFIAVYAVNKARMNNKILNQTLCVAAGAVMLMISLLGKILIYDGKAIHFISGETALKFTMGNDLYNLAQDFKKHSNVNDEYLSDPNDTANVGWFQIVSQRNCYVIYKVIPSSKAMVGDWFARYEQTKFFDKKSGTEIAKIMANAAIKYLLVKADSYSKIEEVENFTIFLHSPNDSFRIYKLENSDQGSMTAM